MKTKSENKECIRFFKLKFPRIQSIANPFKINVSQKYASNLTQPLYYDVKLVRRLNS
jgi:hypothetical protein